MHTASRSLTAPLAFLGTVLVTALVPVVVLAQTLGGGPVAAASTGGPRTGVIFNDPSTGVRADAYQIVNALQRMIEGAPSGSTIRVATLRFDIHGVASALIRAHKRGVRVRVVVPRLAVDSPEVVRLIDDLGSDPTRNSYAVSCVGGCHVRRGGAMHAKLYLFSETGGRRQVSVASSANLATKQAETAWNDAYINVGTDALYNAAVDYFDDLWKDRRTPFAERIDTPAYRVWYFPTAQDSTRPDYYTRMLEDNDCSGVSDGGSGGPTVLRFTASVWAADRLDVAQRFVELHEAGCDVRIVMGTTRSDPEILQTLYDGGVPVRVRGGEGYPVINHSKFLAISGLHHGQLVDTVYTGSLNPNGNGVLISDDQAIRIKDDPATYQAYQDHFDYMWDQSPDLTGAEVAEAEPIPARLRAE
jgi:hypothetical protein